MVAKRKRTHEFAIGLFVSLGILLLIATIFLIGKQRRIFERTVNIETQFPNVAGLSVGADVMLSGVLVGNVAAIRFPILSKNMPGLVRDITVVMKLSRRSLDWIREDSVARIDSKGLLGDKIINISIGSPELPGVLENGLLKSTPPLDFNKALQQAQEILENVTETVSDARDIFKGFVAEGGDVALAGTAKSLGRIFKEIEEGGGVLHELIYDKKGGHHLKETLAKVDSLSKTVDQITLDIKNGEGLVHALVYDKSGKYVINNMNKSLDGLANLLSEIKSGEGILHDLIYAKDKGNFLRSLNLAAADLQSLMADVNAGKGSLGLLLRDPGLYNELYGLLGNLNRNRLLKAVVRYGISHENKVESPPANKK